jgi:hypothetical protein
MNSLAVGRKFKFSGHLKIVYSFIHPIVTMYIYFLNIDEGALVEGAKLFGFSFNVRTPTSVIINAVS